MDALSELGFGVLGIAVVALILGAPYLVGRIFSTYLRRVEEKRIVHPTLPSDKREPIGPATILIAALGILVEWIVTFVAPPPLKVVMVLLSVPCMVCAWGMHQLPGHSRVTKYAVFTVGAAAFGGIRESANAKLPSHVTATMLSVVLVVTIVSVGLALTCFRPDEAMTNGTSSAKRTALWYRRVTWIQGTDLTSVLVLVLLNITGITPAYLLVRFVVKGKMAERPILFLRSFGYTGAPMVFSKLILPGIGRYGVVTGLVGVRQSSETLQKGASALWRTILHAIPDEHWMHWVNERLQLALGAIVDISQITEAVSWELERAVETLGSERIFVLHSGSVDHIAIIERFQIRNSCTLSTGWGAKTEDNIRRLAEWGHTLTRPFVSDPTAVVFGRLRDQIPLLFYIYAELFALLAVPMAVFSLPRYRAAQIRAAETSARAIRAATQNWQSSTNESSCPNVSQLVEEKHLDSELLLTDPWGEPFVLTCTEDDILVHSNGPDKENGTKDDIQIPKPQSY